MTKKLYCLASASLASLLVGLGCIQRRQVQICKVSDQQDPVTGAFHFTVTGQVGVFDMAAGACLTVPNIGTSAITITEQAVTDVAVAAITAQNAVSSGPPDLEDGSITITTSDSAAKVTFTNASVPHGVARWT